MPPEETENTSNADNSDESTQQPDGLKALESRLSSVENDLGEAIKRRDAATKRARDAEAKLEELTHNKAKESNDVEAIVASYQAKLESKDTALNELKGQFDSVVIDGLLRTEAAGVLTKGGTDLLLKVHRSDLIAELDEETKETRVKVKNSADSPKDLVLRFAETNPGLKEAQLESGMGSTANKTKTGSAASGLPSGFANWSDAQKTEYIHSEAAKSPERIKELFKLLGS